jgi:hypothetical protein
MSKKELKVVEPALPKRPEHVVLSPEEQAEADRFRQLTLERAAKEAVVRRLIARLNDEEDLAKAA